MLYLPSGVEKCFKFQASRSFRISYLAGEAEIYEDVERSVMEKKGVYINATRRIDRWLRREVLGTYEELTSLDKDDYTGKVYDQIVVRNSRDKHAAYLVLAIIFLISLVIGFVIHWDENVSFLEEHWLFSMFFSPSFILVPIFLFKSGMQGFTDRKPKLIVDPEGIWTDYWHFTWEEVIETKFKYWRNESTRLIVKMRTAEEGINLGDLNVSFRFLGHHIELFKQRATHAQQRHAVE